MVSVAVVEVTTQFVTSKGSQITASIDEKFCLVDIVFFGESVQERRRRIGPVPAEDVDFQPKLRLCIDRGVQTLLLTVHLNLLLIDRDPPTVCASCSKLRRENGQHRVIRVLQQPLEPTITSKADAPRTP